MDLTPETILDEMKRQIDKWIAYISDKDANQIIKRTSLQLGIHDYALLEYEKGRVAVTDNKIDFGIPEASAGKSRSAEMLTEELVREWIVPELAAYIKEAFQEIPSAVIDYRFTWDGKFQTREGEILVLLYEYIDEAKKNQLLERISDYIAKKLEGGKYPTKPLETFFLSRHLLDEGLFPELDAGRIISVFEKIQQVNKGNKHLAEHRSNVTSALRNWVEDSWLPRYFDPVDEQLVTHYKKKSGARLENTERGSVELVIYTAVMILKYQPSYSRSTGLSMLNCAIELGSEKAKRLTAEGSGTLAAEDVCRSDEWVECKANDVFAEVTLVIKQETQESYDRALRFLISLLRLGFPKSYEIKLKSGAKHWLPIKGLAKSGTHRFFAQALEYPDLHPLLEEYARTAMETFEWYTDTEGEKSCMPGSYAVFGLGLTDRAYFPLVEEYMARVDEEHQSVQNLFTIALAERHGVNADTIPVLVKCMLHSSDSMKLKIKAEMEDDRNLGLLLEQVRSLRHYEVEHIYYLIWGGTDKLKKLAAKAGGERAQQLNELVGLAGRR